MTFAQQTIENNLSILESAAKEAETFGRGGGERLKNNVWHLLRQYKRAGYVEDVAFDKAMRETGIKKTIR